MADLKVLTLLTLFLCIILYVSSKREKTEKNSEKRLVLHSDDDIVAELHKLGAEIQSLRSTVTKLTDQSSQGSGSTYVRWGRTVCEANGTETVYSGFAGGSWYSYAGGAADYICLTSEPIWGVYDDTAQTSSGRIYGTEYEFGLEFGYNDGGVRFFGKNLHNHDVPCAVCRSVRPTTLMIPGRNKCYPGWTQEYAGYLVSGRQQPTHALSSTQYVCLDSNPDVEFGDHVNENGKLMVLVEGVCGSLKCPPYVENRELTCVVCTK